MLKQLEHLDLENNEIESLRLLFPSAANDENNEIDTVYNLRTLNLKNNHIHSLDALNDVEIPCLEKIFLYKNKITSIPCEDTMNEGDQRNIFNKWKYLQHVDLGRNNLEYLPKQMFKQNKLIMSLILYENMLRHVPDGLHHVLLRELWLNGNRISTVDFGPDSYTPMLETLHLHDNSIETIVFMPNAPFLKHIDLSFNNIEDFNNGLDVQVLKKYKKSLKSLRLNDNPICELPNYRSDIINSLPHLIELDGTPVTLEERVLASKNHPNYVNGDQVESWNKMDALYDGIGPFNVSKYNTINWNHTLLDTTNLHNNERNALWKSQRFEQMCINQRQERNELLRKNKSELMAASASNKVHLSNYHDKCVRELCLKHFKEHELFDNNTPLIAFKKQYDMEENHEAEEETVIREAKEVVEKPKQTSRPKTA